jgi:hypothetical protein
LDVLNRVLYWWGLSGVCSTLGLFLLMLARGDWGWAAFAGVLIGFNCGTLWLNARSDEYRRSTHLLRQQSMWKVQ